MPLWRSGCKLAREYPLVLTSAPSEPDPRSECWTGRAAAKAAVEPPRNHRRETDWEVYMVGSLHFVVKEETTATGDRPGRAVRASIDVGGRSNPE